MLLKVLRFLFGFVKVEVYGYAPWRVMNYIIQNDIVIWDVNQTDQGIIFCIGKRNVNHIKKYLQITNCKMKQIEKNGLPFVIKHNKGRTCFLFGLLLGAGCLYMLSLFVWEIDIVGEKKLVKEQILKTVESDFVKLGTLKKKIDCKQLEEDLRERYEDLSWVSCSLEGTKLTISLEEGEAIQRRETVAAADLVASKDAVVTDVITRSGTPMVKAGSKVKKGDVLISGTIYILDDNNEVLETNYLCAEGDVYGETTVSYEDYVDLTYYEKKYASKKNKYIGFYILQYDWMPLKPHKTHEKNDICTITHKCKLFKDFYLPLGYKVSTSCKYSLVRRERTVKEAKEILQKRLNKKITEFKEKKVEIIQNNVKIEQMDGKLKATGYLQLKESIKKLKQIR